MRPGRNMESNNQIQIIKKGEAMQAGQEKAAEGGGNTSIKNQLMAVCMGFLAMMQLPAAAAEESGFIDNRQCFGCHKPQKQTYQDSVHGRAFSADATGGRPSCPRGG